MAGTRSRLLRSLPRRPAMTVWVAERIKNIFSDYQLYMTQDVMLGGYNRHRKFEDMPP
jgi:hypothetical protein